MASDEQTARQSPDDNDDCQLIFIDEGTTTYRTMMHRSSTKLGRVMKEFCDQHGLELKMTGFRWKGKDLEETAIAASVGQQREKGASSEAIQIYRKTEFTFATVSPRVLEAIKYFNTLSPSVAETVLGDAAKEWRYFGSSNIRTPVSRVVVDTIAKLIQVAAPPSTTTTFIMTVFCAAHIEKMGDDADDDFLATHCQEQTGTTFTDIHDYQKVLMPLAGLLDHFVLLVVSPGNKEVKVYETLDTRFDETMKSAKKIRDWAASRMSNKVEEWKEWKVVLADKGALLKETSEYSDDSGLLITIHIMGEVFEHSNIITAHMAGNGGGDAEVKRSRNLRNLLLGALLTKGLDLSPSKLPSVF